MPPGAVVPESVPESDTYAASSEASTGASAGCAAYEQVRIHPLADLVVGARQQVPVGVEGRLDLRIPDELLRRLRVRTQVVAQNREQWDRTLARLGLRLDRPHLLVPAELDVDQAGAQLDVADTLAMVRP
jgi:hypothetical protein